MTVKKKTVRKKATKKSKPAINTPDNYVFGRPTKYKKEFGPEVLKRCMSGELITTASICCFLEISRDTFYEWLDKFEDFSDSIKKAKEYRMQTMEEHGLKGVWGGKAFNGVPWIFLMKNMFPEEYRDRHEIKHGNADDKDFKFAFNLDEKPGE